METENQSSNSTQISNVMRPLSEAAGWMKFLGVLSIIYGVIIALSIVGLLIAWLPIWVGVLLFGAANQSQDAHTSGDENHAVQATSKLKTIYIIYGILALIGLAVVALSFFLGMAGMLAKYGMQG